MFLYVITPTYEFFEQNCVLFPRLHYHGTHIDFWNHISLKDWDILSHVISTAFLHTCLIYRLSFKTDHDRILTKSIAKSIVSKETLCDIWLTINLRGKKRNAALIFTASQPKWKRLFSLQATLNRIKIPRRTIKESFFFNKQISNCSQLPDSKTL